MKVKTFNLFAGKNDIRKYCHVDMMDGEKEELSEELGVDYDDIEMVLSRATIFVRIDSLPEEIEVEEGSDS